MSDKSEKKGWGSTVLGWFIVEDEAAAPEQAVPVAETASPDTSPQLDTPRFFTKDPPAATGGQVDFDGVFDAAGIGDEERQRVARAIDLVRSLPADTPVAVRKQIVEASLKAFGVPIDKIIEAGVGEIHALEGYIRAGAADTQKLLQESTARIGQYEHEIGQIRTVMDERVQEQQAVVKSCNDRKLEIQQILEFFGQQAVAEVVRNSPRLREPAAPPQSS
jgi:hypothetical protein